ncbi:MAG: hypothetical protein WAM91_10950 [Candidatus Acidiferrales bacterium]
MRTFYQISRIVVFLLLLQALALDAFVLTYYGWPLVHGGFKELHDRILWTNAIFGFQSATHNAIYAWLFAKIGFCIVATTVLFLTRIFLIRKIEALTPPKALVSSEIS